MNRREALRLLVTLPIAAPAALKAAAEPDWRDFVRAVPIDVSILTTGLRTASEISARQEAMMARIRIAFHFETNKILRLDTVLENLKREA